MKNSIVTKTGDTGKTSLFGEGIRVLKSNIRVETYGQVDELNSIIGIILSESTFKEINEILEKIQNQLFEIGSDLAIPNHLYLERNSDKKKLLFQKFLDFLESKIDQIEPKLPELKNFILPGGTKCSGYLHLARTVCRRVERTIVLLMETENLNNIILKYFNRLSDLFFILARFDNLESQIEDKIWKSYLK